MKKRLLLLDKFAHFIATCSYIGNISKAPGTWGSIPGVFLGYLLYSSFSQSFTGIMFKVIALCLLCIPALWSIKVSEARVLKHDDKSIVIDEVIGQAIVISFIAPGMWNYLIAFALFRFFDIVKMGPVKWADSQPGKYWGTLLDDVFAGIIALVIALIIL